MNQIFLQPLVTEEVDCFTPEPRIKSQELGKKWIWKEETGGLTDQQSVSSERRETLENIQDTYLQKSSQTSGNDKPYKQSVCDIFVDYSNLGALRKSHLQ